MPVTLTKPRRTGGARAETRTATKNPTASHFSGKRFKSSLIHKQYEAQMTHDEGRLGIGEALLQQAAFKGELCEPLWAKPPLSSPSLQFGEAVDHQDDLARRWSHSDHKRHPAGIQVVLRVHCECRSSYASCRPSSVKGSLSKSSLATQSTARLTASRRRFKSRR